MIERNRNPPGGILGGFSSTKKCTTPRCQTRWLAEQQIAPCPVRALCIQPIGSDPRTEAEESLRQGISTWASAVHKNRRWMSIRGPLHFLDIDGASREVNRQHVTEALARHANLISSTDVGILFLEEIAVDWDLPVNANPQVKLQPCQSRSFIQEVFIR